MRFLWVGFGGACGSIARYAIGVCIDESHFPWATLAINLFGAFVLGLFLTLGLGYLSVALMTPIAVGMIGGFTTFSTFMWERFTFGRTGRAGVALVYISVSIVGVSWRHRAAMPLRGCSASSAAGRIRYRPPPV